MIIVLLLLFLLAFVCTFREHFHNKRIILYNFLYGNKIVPYHEIYPLKKYTFYNRQLTGPNTVSLFRQLYSPNYMTYGKRKYGSHKPFKLINFSPAKVISQHHQCNAKTPRCIFWKSKNYMIPPCCASHLTELLFYLTDLFDKHKIDYFIYYGTLLGSIRHKGLIPWDTDADLFINLKSKSRLAGLQPEIERDTHYKLKLSNSARQPSRLSFSRLNKIHIDIYTFSTQ